MYAAIIFSVFELMIQQGHECEVNSYLPLAIGNYCGQYSSLYYYNNKLKDDRSKKLEGDSNEEIPYEYCKRIIHYPTTQD